MRAGTRTNSAAWVLSLPAAASMRTVSNLESRLSDARPN